MQWNQTNYYTLNSDRLIEYLEQQNAGSIENSEMCVSTPQLENNQTFEVRDPLVSYIETKNTNQKETAKQSAAASFKLASEEENNQKNKLTSFSQVNGCK